jgi:hypothetical protein
MDAKRTELERKLENYLKQASAIAAELQALDQGDRTPHFDQIELPAHEVGRRLSRMVQTTRAREVAADGLQSVPCPDCDRLCRVETQEREVQSVDGPIQLTETVAHCRPCRRSFFPSA